MVKPLLRDLFVGRIVGAGGLIVDLATSGTTNAFCPTGKGGGVDPTCSPRGRAVAPRSQSSVGGPDSLFRQVQESMIADAAVVATSDRVRQSVEKYHYVMSEDHQGARLERVRQEVLKVGDKVDKLQKAYDDIVNKLELMTHDPKVTQEQLHKQAEKVDLGLQRLRNYKNKIRDKALAVVRDADARTAGLNPQVKVKVGAVRHTVTDDQRAAVRKVEKLLSGIVSRWHAPNLVNTDINGIPAGDEQRSYYKGKRHGGATSSVFLRSGAYEAAIVHELGHALETHPRVHALALGFLHSRINGEPAKPLGAGYRADEVGRDDDFFKAFGSNRTAGRYVGKHYKSADTEIISMGLEKFITEPVDFARKDPEYFKFIKGVLDGSLL